MVPGSVKAWRRPPWSAWGYVERADVGKFFDESDIQLFLGDLCRELTGGTDGPASTKVVIVIGRRTPGFHEVKSYQSDE